MGKHTAIILDWKLITRETMRADIAAGSIGGTIEAIVAGLFKRYDIEARDPDEVFLILNLQRPEDYALRAMRRGDAIVCPDRRVVIVAESGFKTVDSEVASGIIERIEGFTALAPVVVVQIDAGASADWLHGAPEKASAMPPATPVGKKAKNPNLGPKGSAAAAVPFMSIAVGRSTMMRGCWVSRVSESEWIVAKAGEAKGKPMALEDAIKAYVAKRK